MSCTAMSGKGLCHGHSAISPAGLHCRSAKLSNAVEVSLAQADPAFKAILVQIPGCVEQGSEIADVSTYEQKHKVSVCCVCPCLTRSRLKVHPSGYYLPKLRRRLSAREAGRLQGWPLKLLDKLLTRFGPQQVGGALGDGMSINVLSKVLLAALVAIGELSAEEGRAREICGAQTIPWCLLPLLTRQCSPHRTFEEIGPWWYPGMERLQQLTLQLLRCRVGKKSCAMVRGLTLH